MSLSDAIPSNLKLDKITAYAAGATLLLLFATNYVFDAIAATQFMKSLSEAVKGLLFAAALPVFNGLRFAFLRRAGVGPVTRHEIPRNDVAAGLVAALLIIIIFSIVGFFGGLALGAACGSLVASLDTGMCMQTMFGSIALFMILPITLLFSLWFGWIAYDRLSSRWWKFLLWSLLFLTIGKGIDYYFTVRLNLHTDIGVANDASLFLGQLVLFPVANAICLALGYGLNHLYRGVRNFISPVSASVA